MIIIKNTKMKKIIASVCVAVMSTVSLGSFYAEKSQVAPSAKNPIGYFTREELLGLPWDRSRDDCFKACQEAVEKFLLPHHNLMNFLPSYHLPPYHLRRVPPIDPEHKRSYAEFLFKCVDVIWEIIPKIAKKKLYSQPEKTHYFWKHAAGLGTGIFFECLFPNALDENFQKSFIINNGEKLTQAQCLMNILLFLAAVYTEDYGRFMEVFDRLESGFLYKPETDPENPERVFEIFDFTYLELFDRLEKHLRDGGCYTFVLRLIPLLNCDYDRPTAPLIFLLLREELLSSPEDGSRDDCLEACQEVVDSEHKRSYVEFLFKCVDVAWEIIPKDAIQSIDTSYFWEYATRLTIDIFRSYHRVAFDGALKGSYYHAGASDEGSQKSFIINNGEKLTQAQCLMNILLFLAAVYIQDHKNFMKVFDWLESGFLYRPETDPKNPKKVFKEFNFTYLEWLDSLKKYLNDGDCYTFVLFYIPLPGN
ncbi:MAG: hypothetical protein CfP315_0761 [Candidatus Improbicoccus pseudotrichonymphae]|uniref:Uncharacterized protein n=1 Tax=Candidatus Improbicoccus pseudotrichonymphae TaxID=3033792 RepID=A0AA48I8R8_9FIRM|nr:MAG: hypothetical protein CfP315_0761 [Candidatus Improbicoccus pseudotrichonymphae]